MKKNISEILSYIIVIAIAILFKMYIASPIRVDGDSMTPTLRDGDIMILNEIGYLMDGVNRFDIVVVKKDGDRVIKRIIGLPGEVIEYKDNKLYVNDKEVEEDFLHEVTHNFKLSEIDVKVIPDDYYFVLGDNRTNSRDSRMFGLVSKDEIKGKTTTVLFPFSRYGKVK